MNKKVIIVLGWVLGIIIVLFLLHLGKNWLIPIIIRMHSAG